MAIADTPCYYMRRPRVRFKLSYLMFTTIIINPMNRKNYINTKWLAGALLVLGLWSCQRDDLDETEAQFGTPDQFNATLAIRWNELFLDIERFTPGYRPPISARTAGYIGLIAYETILPGMETQYNSFDGYFQGLNVPSTVVGEVYHWPTALNAAYAQAFADFFPTAPSAQLFRIFALERDFEDQFRGDIPNEVLVRSREFGRQVARAIFQWSTTDRLGDAAYLRNNDPNYTPPSGFGYWQPTFPDYSPALLPYWGQIRTFVADETDRCPTPLAYSESTGSDLYRQAEEVYRTVNQIKAGQRRVDHWIADFWSDDCPILTFTPAGRWVAVTNQVVTQQKVNLARAVETYARVGLALADAGIRAWHEKYRYNVERPVDYIRRVMRDPTWNTLMCPDGSGRFFTPPFPAYPSGHATFGAAAAEVLTGLYGQNYRMTDRCHEGRTEFLGQPRTFDSFYEMAEENGYSRIPIGVHFKMDSDAGLQLGYGIGRKVNALPWRK